MLSSEAVVMVKFKQQPKKIARSLYSRIPKLGRILLPVAVLAVLIYAVEWVASLFL